MKVIESMKDVAQSVASGSKARRQSAAARVRAVRLERPQKGPSLPSPAAPAPKPVAPATPARSLSAQNTELGLWSSLVDRLFLISQTQMRQMAKLLVEHGCLCIVAAHSVKQAEATMHDAEEDEEEEAQDGLDDCTDAWTMAHSVVEAYRDAYLCLADLYDGDSPVAVTYLAYKEALAAKLQNCTEHPGAQPDWFVSAIRRALDKAIADPTILSSGKDLFA